MPFLGVLIVPLEQNNHWHQYQFKSIKPNTVKFLPNSIDIHVDQSSSPLLYIFDKPLRVTQLQVKAVLKGQTPQIPAGKTEKEFDDFTLRVGLILKGKGRLNWAQRIAAPKWVIDMEKLLPQNAGIDKVYFFTTCQNQQLINQTYFNYTSKKFKQTCVKLLKSEGEFKIESSTIPHKEVLGLWIGSNGDHTQSKFQVELKEILINHN